MPSRGKSGQSERSASLDPFALALQPPANETPDEQAERTRMAKLALEQSRKIDEGILEDKKAFDRKHRAVRVLLLGQAESGKSTLLKNFKLAFCPTQFATETAGWKTVIQLNLIRSVSTLLAVLQEELDRAPPSNGSSSRRPYSSGRGAAPTFGSSTSPPPSRITNEHRRLRMRLSPLIAIDEALTRKLHHTFPDAAHWTPRGDNDPSKYSPGHGRKDSEGLPPLVIRRGSSNELCVRAGADWQNILAAATSKDIGRSRQATGSDDPTGALDACREDIEKLWKDEVMRDLLLKRNIRMEMGSGFFLDDVARIARMDYEPTTKDILRARLKTIGIEEHHLELSADGHAQDWYIYDVNGSRNTRPRWVQYFDNASAIVFLAPLAFNQFLEEDPSTNRLEDTVGLWSEICRNRLLRHATLVLLFNKRDLLARTLDEGERVVRFIPSYQGANDPSEVTAYFKHKFVGIHKKFFQKERDLFVHETTCIDAKTTETILYGVRHAILTEHLRKLDLIV